MERNKTLNGFTLTEILVVLFIISLLSGVTFANYRQGGKQMALQRSAYKFAQDIRRAQEMAIGSAESPTPACAGQIPIGGYGIQLKTSPADWREYYVLFADCDGGRDYDEPGELIERIYFEKGTRLHALPATPLRIIFLPPDPTTIFIPAHVTNPSITLRNDGQTKIIRVYRTGLIEIQ